MNTRLSAFILLQIIIALPHAQSSGTYPPSVPVPPATEGSVDYDRYVKGKKIFSGKSSLPKLENPDDYVAKRLKVLSETLNKLNKIQLDMTGLATTLDREMLGYLEYYLQIRYKLVLPQ